MQISTPQILQLAPDAAAAKAGQGLAKLAQWQQLQQHENMVWGLCQGSGKEPYRTQVDLSEPAFKCSCPSRKFPCKHGLGLLLLLANEASAFNNAEMPDWVSAWAQSRSQRAEKQISKQSASADASEKGADDAAKIAQQNKRAEQRQARVCAGIEDAMLWLEDLVRTGLVAARGQSYAFWDSAAARLVDAQAPALARRIRQLPQYLNGADWQHNLLAELGNLYLLTQAFRNLEHLSPEVKADVRTAVGWTYDQQQILQTQIATAEAVWQVMAVSNEQEEQLLAKRTWLQHQTNGQIALLLEFSVANAARSNLSFAPGFQLRGQLAYYPGSVAQRALLAPGYQLIQGQQSRQHGFTDINDFLAMCAQQIAANPWLERSAALLQQVQLVQRNGEWQLRDAAGNLLAISEQLGAQVWQLLAISGGMAFDVFGEWDRSKFLPRSYWHAGAWHHIEQEVL